MQQRRLTCRLALELPPAFLLRYLPVVVIANSRIATLTPASYFE